MATRKQQTKKPVVASVYRPHPWHGLPVGPDVPDVINAFIEMTPLDTLKCEVDKASGYVKVDRPLPMSSLPPAAYGFIPRTYCASRIARLAQHARAGDGDPLDICVVSERTINRVELLVPARILGGVQMIDRGEADDKIIAVMHGDMVWGHAKDLGDLPRALVDRLEHYFRTYKLIEGKQNDVRLARTYGRSHALKVLRAAMADYVEAYG